MKITVLNGSPKGELSITLQSLKFIEKKNPEFSLSVHHVARRIKKIAKDEESLNEIIEDVKTSDAVVWSVPLYVLTVPSQYKHFIELIHEKKLAGAFKDKYCSIITTSIHFFDHTAHNYMRATCEDLGMKVVESFSPDLFDLPQKEHHPQVLAFGQNLVHAVTGSEAVYRLYEPLVDNTIKYEGSSETISMDLKNKKVLILADSLTENPSLAAMVTTLASQFTSPVETVSLEDLDIRGGCLGCCECGPDYECNYDNTDEHRDFYVNRLKKADVIFFASSLKGRYLSWQMKQFIDRSFFNTHTPSLTGKQVGFILSGPFRQLGYLQEILQAYIEWQRSNLTGFITDEYSSPEEITGLIQTTAKRTQYFLEKSYQRPPTFLGVGGMKIFRDDVFGRLRFVFQGDHNHYESHGYYDFPKVDPFSEKMIEAMKDPNARNAVRKMFKAKMVEPHQKIVEEA